jgi:hypothetical protein
MSWAGMTPVHVTDPTTRKSCAGESATSPVMGSRTNGTVVCPSLQIIGSAIANELSSGAPARQANEIAAIRVCRNSRVDTKTRASHIWQKMNALPRRPIEHSAQKEIAHRGLRAALVVHQDLRPQSRKQAARPRKRLMETQRAPHKVDRREPRRECRPRPENKPDQLVVRRPGHHVRLEEGGKRGDRHEGFNCLQPADSADG